MPSNYATKPPNGRCSKYDYMIHAEMAAICIAARNGAPTEGATMYALWASCPDCAKAIVVCGIKRVVTLSKLQQLTPKRWRSRVDTGLLVLKRGHVEVDFIDEPLGEKLLFNGEEVAL